MQTEVEFVLPNGYVDTTGRIHRNGRMRMATAMDEVSAMSDPRVQENLAYLPVILLSNVVVALGDLPSVTPQVIGGIFASDLVYLEDLYQRLNSSKPLVLGAICPHCGMQIQIQVAPLAPAEQP